MESGDRAAGDRHEQDREQVPGPFDMETGEGRQIDGRIGRHDADAGSQQHEDQKVTVQIIARLQQCPYRGDRSDHNIKEYDDMPGAGRNEHGQSQARRDAGDQKADGDQRVEPLVQFGITEQKAEADCLQNEEHAGRRDAPVGSDLRAFRGKAVERAGNDVGKGGDHEDTEQPAEQKEQLFAKLSDVFFNNVADRTSLVFHRGVHRREILHRAEKDAAD